MGRNVEIKARASDFEAQRNAAGKLAGCRPEVLAQEDTFFRTRRGRLKLRSFGEDRGELIYYERENKEAPTESRYMILPTREAPALRAALSKALSVSGTVHKTREVYRVAGTRIHFDDVQELGRFIELEAVLGPDESLDQGRARVAELAAALAISDEDLIDRAYIDLLLESRDEESDP
ncbi:MAG: class IV adenylate cyclase [Candidatus Eisenbacteria bacterium]|nr:class IV adenylate cyclase [Candidatus Eisenbacteria bacterium]